jgi:hypothetical protein
MRVTNIEARGTKHAKYCSHVCFTSQQSETAFSDQNKYSIKHFGPSRRLNANLGTVSALCHFADVGCAWI